MSRTSIQFALKEAIFRAQKSGQVINPGPDGFCVFWEDKGLFAIFSVADEQDDRRWAHVSVSKQPPRIPPSDVWLPSPMELEWVKEQILGDVEAYAVLPVQAAKVNIHPWVLHFFYCYDEHRNHPESRRQDAGAILPDFTRGGKTL